MSRTTARAGALLALLSPLSAQDGAPADHDVAIVRWYDLRGVVETSRHLAPLVRPALHLASGWVDCLEPDAYDVTIEPDGLWTQEVCEDALVDCLRREPLAAWDDWRIVGGRMQLRANRAAHEAFGRTLEELTIAANQAVLVELLRVPAAAVPRSSCAIVPSRVAEAWSVDENVRVLAHQRVLLGRAVGIGDSGVTSFLSDLDVEGYGGVMVYDPVVSVLAMGTESGVRIERTADGERLIVRWWGRDGGPGSPMPLLESPAPYVARYDQPETDSRNWCASAVVASGAAIVVADDRGWALALRLVEERASPRRDRVLALGALATVPMRGWPPGAFRAEPSQGWNLPEEDGFWSPYHGAGERVVDLLDELCPEGLGARLQDPVGTSLLVTGTDEQRAAVRSAVDGMRSSLDVASITVDVRYARTDAPSLPARPTRAQLAAFAEQAPGRLVGAVLEGDMFTLSSVEERAYLRDLDVQISGGMSPPDPIQSETAAGVHLWCAPLRVDADHVSTWIDLQVVTHDTPCRRIRTLLEVSERLLSNGESTFEETFSIQLPQTRWTQARTLVNAAPGDWAHVTTRRLPGSDRWLTAVARFEVR